MAWCLSPFVITGAKTWILVRFELDFTRQSVEGFQGRTDSRALHQWEESWSQLVGMRCASNGTLLSARTPGNSVRALRKLKTRRRGNSSHSRNVCSSASTRTSERDTVRRPLWANRNSTCSLCTTLRASRPRKHYSSFLMDVNQSHLCCIFGC
jgi:hypothetical protein